MLRVICTLLAYTASVWAQKQPFDINALLSLSRISDPQVSPDGKLVAFTAQTVELPANTKPRNIYIVPVSGGPPRKLTLSGTKNYRARWTPDSKKITYISDSSGTPQVWIVNADGSNPRQVTNIANGADDHILTPDGSKVLFISEVYPDCPDEKCNKDRLADEEQGKVKARSYTTLLYRHWDEWQGKRRKHLLIVPLDGGETKDLTPGNLDVPPFSLKGPDDVAISPGGTEVCYVAKPDPVPATSTNDDLFVVPITGGEARKLTDNPGADKSPIYSPDGKYLAYRSQERAGFEADRWRLMIIERETGTLKELTTGMDRPVESFTWSPDSKRLFFTIEDRGRTTVQMMSVDGGGARTIISGRSTIDQMQFTTDGKTIIFTESSGARPASIFAASSGGGSPRELTNLNETILAGHQLNPFEEFWVPAEDGAKIHSFLLKPYEFSDSKKYPVLFFIHGGPQGAWHENWGYRWNPQVFAAAGFVVVMPNPRGSTGYGQKFTDDINADWGGKPYEDIMAVADFVEKLPYVDSKRMAAAGGSYGGYMVNWLLGHTTRFKALVSHAGVFDLKSEFGSTEELWFPLWEFQGTPWSNPEIYEKWSPSSYVKQFHTPTLVIHGEKDFRVPYSQGLFLFTALQMQKVPSKLLVFPDEGHWIEKPQNSVLWYKTFLEWITEWTKPVEPAVKVIGQ